MENLSCLQIYKFESKLLLNI